MKILFFFFVLGMGFLSYLTTDWKAHSVSFMDEAQKHEVLKYHYRKQFQERPEINLANGHHEYKGSLFQNSPNRNPDLSFILQKKDDRRYYIQLFIDNKNGSITGRSSIHSDKSECHFSIKGKVQQGHITLNEAKNKKCDNDVDWFTKSMNLMKGVDGGFFGGWNACGGLSEFCKFGGVVYFDKVDLKAKIATENVEKTKLQNLSNKSFQGKLWFYADHKDFHGNPVNKQEGTEYKISLTLDSLKENGEALEFNFHSKIWREGEEGHLEGVAKVSDGFLEFTENSEINGNSNWFHKSYKLSIDNLTAGEVSAHWENHRSSSDGGFLNLARVEE